MVAATSISMLINCFLQQYRNDDASLNCDIELIASRLIFHIKNNTAEAITVQFIGVFNDIMQFGKLNPSEFPLRIKQGETAHLTSPIFGLSGYNHYVIVYDDVQKHCERIQNYFVELNTDNMRMTIGEEFDEEYVAPNPVLTEPPPEDYRGVTDPSIGIIQAKRMPDILKIMTLPWYEPTPDVKELCILSFHAPSPRVHPIIPHNRAYNLINEYRGLNRFNYFEMLSLSIQIEDFTARLAIENNAKHNRELIRCGNGEFAVKLSLDEGRPLFLTKGDNVWVSHSGKADVRIRGYVKKVMSNEIVLKLRNGALVEQSPRYSIHFEVNRLTFQMERKALDDAYDLNVIDYLFPSEERIEKKELKLPQLQFFDPKIKSDVNQIAAVKHIVAGTAYPYPYLLIGFPGTGKTKVIVESVCQLFTYPQNRILICSSCNTVCDEISVKLLSFLKNASQYQTPVTQKYNILRLYATAVRRSCNDNQLLDNSNFDEKSIPCLEEIYKYRIVVCTLTVAGRLAQGHISKNHFTHLFIDECESASESYTLVPIVGICSSYNSINANVVLTGDPLQLGPIMRSNILKRTELNQSMFLRLYNSETYQKNSRTREYNQRFISKLKNNYRSHPMLVAVPNQLFYNQEIRSSANPAHYKWYSEMDFLPKRGFPILFENIEGNPEKMVECVSWYNQMEIESVVYYVNQLLKSQPRRIKETDIGIISPYKRQCINIAEKLEAERLTKIEVGSVEQFQGKEKPIIIISTVRKGNMGFVLERERINVMITRAMGLLIIIGHKETLMKNADWRRVIDYTTQNCEGEMLLGEDEEADDVGDYRC
ncbi:hypothetical protein HA402_014058 [Bradysia odoriphaga]|nr:hypothetical protein HA402_014058 [Bradysia odoriphaga]